MTQTTWSILIKSRQVLHSSEKDIQLLVKFDILVMESQVIIYVKELLMAKSILSVTILFKRSLNQSKEGKEKKKLF